MGTGAGRRDEREKEEPKSHPDARQWQVEEDVGHWERGDAGAGGEGREMEGECT